LENYLEFSSPFLSRKEMNGSINEMGYCAKPVAKKLIA